MCNKLRILLSTMELAKGDEPMTRAEVVNILKATGEDVERQSRKINEVNEKVDKLEDKVDEMQKTQNIILEMVQSINTKLNDEKIEEKAYLSDKLVKIISNWIFWVAFIGVIAFAGMGVLKILDKADNIATISKAIK